VAKPDVKIPAIHDMTIAQRHDPHLPCRLTAAHDKLNSGPAPAM
jgi:hypothetical protein